MDELLKKTEISEVEQLKNECKEIPGKEFEVVLQQLSDALEAHINTDDFFAERVTMKEDIKSTAKCDFIDIESANQIRNRVLTKIAVSMESGKSGKCWMSFVKIDDNWKIYDFSYSEKTLVQLANDEISGSGLKTDLRKKYNLPTWE